MERELGEEVRTHLEMRVEHLRALGMSESDARAEALRRFGDAGEFQAYAEHRIARKARRLGATQWLTEWTQDLHFARRQFARTPVFTTIAVLTLALGIGANTAIFSVVHRLLLAPLPYPHGNRVVIPMQVNALGLESVDLPLIQAWQAGARSIDMVATATKPGLFDVHGDGTVIPNPNAWMTANYLDMLGVGPVVGRTFSRAEEQSEAAAVAMIGHRLWQREYGGDPKVIGSTIRINDRPHTIVGVAPAGLGIPLSMAGEPDIWLPQRIKAGHVFARLRPGVSSAAASAELAAIASQLRVDGNGRRPVRLMRVQDFLDAREVRSVQVLFVAVGVLLLIACANVANLLLARAWTRRREFAVRIALGARRGRLVRQMLTESMLLAVTGAAVGVAVAWATLRLIVAMRPPGLDHLADVRIEAVVLFWTLGIALATGLLFGCAPALAAGTRPVGDVLRNETRAGTAGRLSQRIRSSLVVLEIAMSLMLLVGAGLLARSFVELQRVRLGFEPHGLVAANVLIGGPWDSGRHTALRAELLDRIRSLPGITGAAIGSIPGAGGPSSSFETEPGASGQSMRASDVATNMISPDYFRVARIAVLDGDLSDLSGVTRAGTTAQSWGTSTHVIVSRSLARRLWPNGAAVGSRVRVVAEDTSANRTEPWSTVVAVVDDVRSPGQRGDIGTMQLYSLLPPTFPLASFLVRAEASGDASVAMLERTAKAIDPKVFVWRVQSGEQHVRDGLASSRFAMALLTAFAVIALVLASVGLYGVIAYGVTQRTREIGVRIALGADAKAVTGLVDGGGIKLTVVGVAIGTVAAVAATRLLDSMLYGVQPSDPLTFSAIVVLVAAIAILASYGPARRALRIDATEALRAD
jgi:putative ABC transport system permease protein